MGEGAVAEVRDGSTNVNPAGEGPPSGTIRKRRAAPGDLFDPDVTWLLLHSHAAIGLKAMSLSRMSRDASDAEFPEHVLHAAARQRRILAALSSLPDDARAAIVVGHTPLPPALHPAAMRIDPLDASGRGIASVCFWACCRSGQSTAGKARDLLFVSSVYDRRVRAPDEQDWRPVVAAARERVARIRGELATDPKSKKTRASDESLEGIRELGAARAVGRAILSDALALFLDAKSAIDRAARARQSARQDARQNWILDVLCGRDPRAATDARASVATRPGRAGPHGTQRWAAP